MLKGKKKLSGAMIQCDRGGGIYDQVLLDTVSRGAQAGFYPRERVRHVICCQCDKGPTISRSDWSTKTRMIIFNTKLSNSLLMILFFFLFLIWHIAMINWPWNRGSGTVIPKKKRMENAISFLL